MQYINTPEIDKLHDVIEDVDMFFDFFVWMHQQKGISLVDGNGQSADFDYYKIRDLVLEYKGVDLAAVDREKQEVIAYLNSLTGSTNYNVRLGFGGF